MVALNSLCMKLILISILVWLPSVAASGNRSAFYVSNATSINKYCLEVNSRSLPFSCHRIFDGVQNVVAIREFHRALSSDRSTFSKLTLVLPEKLQVGRVYNLGEEGVSAFFSKGTSAFAGKSGCYSTAASGQVIVDAMDSDRIELSLEATFILASPLDWPGECDVPTKVHELIKAAITDIGGLGAWEGRPSSEDSPFEEAHPSRR